jgi:hypothetical protein
MGGACSSHGINAFKIFFGKPEEKRLSGRFMRRYEGNIRMDIGEIG